MTYRAWIAALLTLAVIWGAPAHAVFSGDMSRRAESSDKDYAEAIRARAVMDWEPMVAALERVIARRPWHDNGHNLLGYGYRKLERYEEALHHYAIALELNPRHRQALAYLGVAYLHMDEVDKAEATLTRLRTVCEFVALTFSDGEFTDGCGEYHKLTEYVASYRENGFVEEDCPTEW